MKCISPKTLWLIQSHIKARDQLSLSKKFITLCLLSLKILQQKSWILIILMKINPYRQATVPISINFQSLKILLFQYYSIIKVILRLLLSTLTSIIQKNTTIIINLSTTWMLLVMITPLSWTISAVNPLRKPMNSIR